MLINSPLEAVLHDSALGIPLFALPSRLTLFDFRDHILESFGDVLVEAGAGFYEPAAEFLG